MTANNAATDRDAAAATRVKVSDYVARRIADHGARHVFMMTGGGAMHLNDSLGYEPRLQVVCYHHEQACAIAAEGYARACGQMAVVNVTTGPGGINALTGVFGAYTDSIPMLVVSGQVRRDTVAALNNVPDLRQLGDQEVNIIAMVQPIVKYGVMVSDPADIRYEVEKALYLVTEGRPGPVWLDIPIDVQGAYIEPDKLRGFDPPAADPARLAGDALTAAVSDTLDRLAGAERPVLMVGTGVRLAGADALFHRVFNKLGMPVTTAWTAIDMVASDDPLFCGRPGTIGDRGGNFTVQNSDVLLVLGSRLPIRQVSYNWRSFAPETHKIVVDIDPAELTKPMVIPDTPICADAGAFLAEMERQIDADPGRWQRWGDWVAWCKERVNRYPPVTPAQRQLTNGLINPYHFIETLFDQLEDDDVVVCGNASASVISYQAGRTKFGQRVFANAGCAAMGYDLPAAIGAAVARGGKRVICLAGDGSLQLNVQELQTISYHQFPVKLFVINNAGYLSMRMAQGNFFKRLVGESPKSGVSFPDFTKVGAAYGLDTMRVEGGDFAAMIGKALAQPGPVLCDVIVDPAQEFEPKLSSRQLEDGTIVSAQLEDMAPFLSREELASNMLR